jgi:uncharacterized iron-regulated membrane protein
MRKTFRSYLVQAHLWLGLLFAAYALLIGLSGAVIVFKDDLNALRYPQFHTGAQPVFGADPDRVLEQIRQSYPGYRPLSFTWPHDRMPYWMIFLLRPGASLEVYADPATGQIIGARDPRAGWLGWVERLHTNLLWAQPGRLANGYGAIGLILLTASGLYLLWPRWRTLPALWRHERPRFLHYSLGAASALLLVGLAFTGAYYTWSKHYISAVSRWMERTPEVKLPTLSPAPATTPSVWRLMDLAQQSFPGKAIHRFPVPDPRFPLRVTFCESSFAAFHQISSVTLDPRTGAVLLRQSIDERPAGDIFLGWLSGFHFGVFGGLPVQILWSGAGLALALLGPTGVWMWWRRRQSSPRG